MGTIFIELEDVVVYISEEQIKGFKVFLKFAKQNNNLCQTSFVSRTILYYFKALSIYLGNVLIYLSFFNESWDRHYFVLTKFWVCFNLIE